MKEEEGRFLVMTQRGVEIAGDIVPSSIWYVYFPVAIVLTVVGYVLVARGVGKRRWFEEEEGGFERVESQHSPTS